MKRLAIVAVALCTAVHIEAAQFSKLGIITAAKSMQKWESLKSWIEQAGYSDEWQAASFFSDTYPAFPAVTNAVVASGLATVEEVEAILAAAEDKAPDALLTAKYMRDIETDTGRRNWHGKIVMQTLATNDTDMTIMRIDTFEDGFVWTNRPYKVRPPYDPEEAERRQQAWDAAHYPPRLAAIMKARRAAISTTNEITVIIEGN